MEFRLLNAEEIDCRVSQVNQYGVGLLLYKDARCDMNILDETVGVERWQRSHELINGNLFCNVAINFPTAEGFDRWVVKQDVGTESYTEKEKGEASDSFKRACFNWGIGRELYTAPKIFVGKKDLETLEQDKNGKWICKDTFEVAEIEYVNRKIAYVKVLNRKSKNYIEFGAPAEEVKKVEEVKNLLIDEPKKIVLINKANEKGVDIEKVLKRYKVNSVDEMTLDMWTRAINALDKTEG